jgi:hypothetical protein
MKAQTVLTIRGVADLDMLNPYHRARVGFRRIKLDVPGVSDVDRELQEQRINRDYFACGCAEATIFTLIALVAAPVWLVFSLGWEAITWRHAAYALGSVVLASGVGKGIGVMRARHRLRREVEWLRHLLRPRAEPEPEDGKIPTIRRCGSR